MRLSKRHLPRVAILAALLLFEISCGGSSPENGPAGPVAFDPLGCDEVALTLGASSEIAIEHDGLERSYRLYVPSEIDNSTPTPLILNWHGLGSDSIEQEVYSGTAIVEERGYIAAYPKGLGRSFNAGFCCSSRGNPPHQADDVGFARAIVADVASRLCIDKQRIYSSGMSNGGYMSEHLACHAADLVAAVAPVSAQGGNPGNCTPSRPVPMISFNGTEDPLVSYAGSQLTLAGWAERNSCKAGPRREEVGGAYCDYWDSCAEDADVVHCTVPGMAHCWPGDPLGIVIPGFCETGGLEILDANQVMYDFFEQHTLPTD
jgi:polyhydroxybutyrate depolymerase